LFSDWDGKKRMRPAEYRLEFGRNGLGQDSVTRLIGCSAMHFKRLKAKSGSMTAVFPFAP